MLVKLCLVLFGIAVVTSRHINFYRKDYVYVDEYDAFYKLHWDINGSSWGASFLACDSEGAELFYPQTNEEWTVVKKLVNIAPVAPNVSEIFVGIHDKFGLGEFLTIHGRPPSTPIPHVNTDGEDQCVTMNIDSGALVSDYCYTTPNMVRPFVCKKVEDVSCPTIDKGYKYSKETKKCYKINDRRKSWSQAMETCYMEGGILVVVNSGVEAEVLRDKLIGDENYHAGFNRMFPNEEFYNVQGHKLQDSGYNSWYDENAKNSYDCGVIRRSNNYNRLYLHARQCDTELPFVCEMEIPLQI